ncbi:MAG: hypothetical protein V9G24_05370 [Rhodoblastus sp.]
MARGGVEIRDRVIKGEAARPVLASARQCAREPEVERGIGDHVDQRGTCGQDAMLDAQVRAAIGVEADERPVPAPDDAIVQAQMPELLWRRIEGHRQQRIVDARILLEHLEQRMRRIARAHRHARRPRRNHGLLEQGNARFLPQRPAEQERRIARRRQHRRGDGDGGIVIGARLARRRLEMNLEGGRRRLQHHVEMF